MSIERYGTRIEFVCDGCGELYTTDPVSGVDLGDAWDQAASEGWRARLGDDRVWTHVCPDCKLPEETEEKQEEE